MSAIASSFSVYRPERRAAGLRAIVSRMRILALLLAFLGITAFASAQNLTGTVTNLTTGKPAAGVEVAVVDPMQGMADLNKTTTDAQGRYSLPQPPATGPHLVRATRDGVNYFQMITPGTTSANVNVYDAAKKLAGIAGTVYVMRAQADSSSLQVIELYAVQNNSKPARTFNADNTFEVQLPNGAQVDGADAQGPGGQPIQVAPQPTSKPNHYAFSYPLKPGETRIQIAYHLPYSGQATITPHILQPFQHFVVVLPQTMTFSPQQASSWQPMNNQPGEIVQVATDAKPGNNLAFGVSGTGTVQDDQQAQGSDQGGTSTMGGTNENRPGGGLGAPIQAPDAIPAKYRWWIMGILAFILAGVAYLLTSRGRQNAPAVTSAGSPVAISPEASAAITASAASVGSGSALLQAMKEELFQLEIERQQGQLSPEEYEKAKAALDQTLARALARSQRS